MISYEDIIKELDTNPEYVLSEEEWEVIRTRNKNLTNKIDTLVKERFKDHEWTYVRTFILSDKEGYYLYNRYNNKVFHAKDKEDFIKYLETHSSNGYLEG